MRHVYSVIRFVPDPIRGEFVNIGAIVGSEDSSEWTIRQIDNPMRARQLDENKVLDAVWGFMDHVGRQIDEYLASLESLYEAPVPLTEGWLTDLYEEHRNIVQLTPPMPMVADNAEDAMNRIFDLMVVDPIRRKFPYQKKHAALAELRRAYQHHRVRRRQNLKERVLLEASAHRERIDFAVTNGNVLQLAHTWSFQVPDQDLLAEQIKAWGWTMAEVRKSGGFASTQDGSKLQVPPDVDIEVVFVPPARGHAPIEREAKNVFEALDVRAVPLGEGNTIGERAHKLLVDAGVDLDYQEP